MGAKKGQEEFIERGRRLLPNTRIPGSRRRSAPRFLSGHGGCITGWHPPVRTVSFGEDRDRIEALTRGTAQGGNRAVPHRGQATGAASAALPQSGEKGEAVPQRILTQKGLRGEDDNQGPQAPAEM